MFPVASQQENSETSQAGIGLGITARVAVVAFPIVTPMMVRDELSYNQLRDLID